MSFFPSWLISPYEVDLKQRGLRIRVLLDARSVFMTVCAPSMSSPVLKAVLSRR
ncbi:MAG TPA: hypothetical protein VF790_06255 [Dissulfurispiraceae bacterium]